MSAKGADLVLPDQETAQLVAALRAHAAFIHERVEVVLLQAALGGMVSGRLAEWPHLRRAFEALGLPADPTLGAHEMPAQARAALEGATTGARP